MRRNTSWRRAAGTAAASAAADATRRKSGARRLPAGRVAAGGRAPGEERIAVGWHSQVLADDGAAIQGPRRVELHLEVLPVPEVVDEPPEAVVGPAGEEPEGDVPGDSVED